MSCEIKFLKKPMAGSEIIAIPVRKDKSFTLAQDILGPETQDFIRGILENKKNFKAAAGEVLTLYLPPEASIARVALFGFEASEKDKRTSHVRLEETGGKLYAGLSAAGAGTIALYTGDFSAKESAALANGFLLRSYRFEKYKSKKSEKDSPVKPEKLHIISDNHAAAQDVFKPLEHITQGVFLARDLVNEPPNTLYPESFAKIAKEQLKPLGVEIEILDEKKMSKMGMGAITAVGQGSARQPRMVIMRWRGGKKNESPLGFVGKGVTFDTGGISLKPGAGMEDMKMDMGGAAAVTGLMKSLALRKAKVNVVGIIGLAENMPSDNAYRPADIITSYSGKMIEVLNTDAEGRLVLADCLTHMQKEYKPQFIIDLATLTGAMMVALGHEYCGVFSTCNELWEHMDGASTDTGEKLWRMPLDEVWYKDMEGRQSDLQNMPKSGGRWAGACTAAEFLHHFIEDGTPWAHMDIAGVAWRKQDKPTIPKYGSGFGVRVLDRFVSDYYEE